MRRGKVGQFSRFLPYVVVAVVVSVVVSLVVTSRGVVNQLMDLNNSGVWVTNDSQGLWGRVNRSAGALDAALDDPNRESGNVNIDVCQDGEAVLAWNMTQFRLFPVDTRDSVAATTTPFGLGMVGSVAMGGGVIATITSDKGELRTTSYTQTSVPDVAGLGADRTARATLPVVSGLESNVDVAVDSQGRVFAASASGQWVMIVNGEVTYGNLDQSLRSVAVSLVGGVGVVVDSTSGDVVTTTGIHQNFGTGVVPQQPGEDTTRIIVGTRSGLEAMSIPSGETTTLYTARDTSTIVAEPVVMGAVVYGAWGGTSGLVVRIDSSDSANPLEDTFPKDKTPLVKPVFRVNRGSVVLNDMATGKVFDIEEKWAMETWDNVAPDSTQQDEEEKPDSEDSPRAKDDHLWARPGLTSVLHVMDNDTNPGTGIVAITDVTGPDANKVTISPDGQTLLADVPPTQREDMSLAYTITNRAASPEEEDEESSALVTISVRSPSENSLPYQADTQGSDETVPDFTVPSEGTLSIAPAGWWRDADSDQVSVISASAGDRIFPVTAQGLIQYHAPSSPGQLTERLDYTVSDGYGMPVPGILYIRVQSNSELQSIPPIAMSDSVRAVVDEPHVFYPLDNDVPGCDPLDKQAHLVLASPVSARVGIEVSTDLLTGAVTITADHVGAYFLDYVAGFGSGFSAGKIRVDVGTTDQVVAMPDTAVVHGTVPVVVDALSNDHDQLGSILTITSAVPRDPDRVRVGILQGRWLRIDLVSSVIDATPTLIDYSVTNGGSTAIGQVSVTQTPMPVDDHLSIVDDQATVRVGDVTTIAVLNNDSSQSGEPLVLNDNVEGMANAGQLRVDNPSAPNSGEDVGQAFTDGNKVRYVAPTSGEGKRVRITYQAGIAAATPDTGHVWVDVIPEPTPETETEPPAALMNNVPTPGSVEARVVIGDAVRIPVATYGQDPDGDSVTVAGLRTPPKYGRVVDVGADFLTYESYPDIGNVGIDSFQFYVQDRFGAVGIGTARIGLSKPGEVSPPLSVDDVVTAQPGVEVTVFPMSNDVVPIGTGETSIVVNDPDVVVDQEAQTLVTTAPGAGDPAVSISYYLDAGGVPGTSAQVMVRSVAGYLNPPDVFDHAAEIVDGTTAAVDVLDNAWDVDGPHDQIHIISVGSAGSFDGATVSVPILDRGQVVPFVVEDGTGAQAMAVVFVPSLTDGRPTLDSDGLIRMDRNGTLEVNLTDYISSPRHQDVHLTLASQVWTAPRSYLDFTVMNDQQITLQARADYVGPAALTVEVRDSPDATDPAALTGVVTIPVQIGAATPVLWCPEDIQEIVQGGLPRSLDVAELCHAWMPTQTEVDALVYRAEWAQGGDEIMLTGKDQGGWPSDVVTLQALPASRPGVDNTLTILVDGYDVTGQLRVRVIPAPKPTMSVSSVADVQAGTTVDVPVTVISPMAAGVQNIVSVTPTSGPSSKWTFTDRTIQVTPEAAGVLVFDVVGSDITDDSRTDRQVTASFSVTVFGVPDPPSAPQPGTQLRSGSAVVTFQSGGDNGAPILGFEVKWDGGSFSCGLNTTCEIPDLTNGKPYRFQVRAINKAGESDWSELGPEVIPNAIPGAVTGLTASSPDCGSVLLSWGETLGEGTPPTMYHLTWNEQTAPVTTDGANNSFKPTGLDNNNPYTFTIVAENEAGVSQLPTKVTSQSSCKPMWPVGNVSIEPTDMGDTAQISVSWPEADPQGPGPVTYSVTRRGPDGMKTFAPTTELSLGDTGDELTFNGKEYTYTVTATNATGGTAHTSSEITGTYTAIGKPDSWASVGGTAAVSVTAQGDDGQIIVHVEKFPKFRDSSGEVRVSIANTQVAVLKPGSDSATLSGYVNGTNVEASFTACNSSSCNMAQTSSLPGGPFGRLAAPLLTPRLGDGRQVCFTASGSGNGRGATLIVTGDNGAGEFRSTSSVSPSLDRCTEVAWDTDTTFTAYLSSDPTTPSRKNSDSISRTIRSATGTPDEWASGAVTATPTVVDELVQSGSVTLNVSSFPASNGGTLAVTYTVVPGGTTGVIPPSGSTVVSGLSNGTSYSFLVTASNGVSHNTPVTVTSTPPYGLLDAMPEIIKEPSEGTKVCLHAVTPDSGTNGAPANLVLSSGDAVLWQSGLTTSAIDSGKQCFDTNDYNKQMTVDAQLIAGPGQARPDSPFFEAILKSAIGTPGELSSSNILVTATGVSGQARIELTGDLPPSNGGENDPLRVDITGVPRGGTVSVKSGEPIIVEGFTDGTATALTFASCNAETCNKTTIQKTVTTVGKMTNLRLGTTTPPEGTTRVSKEVCAEFIGEANGGQATLEIRNSINPDQVDQASNDRTVTKTSCVDAGGPNVTVAFSARLIDTSGVKPPRESLELNDQTVVSAADAGAMTVLAFRAPTITYPSDGGGKIARVCMQYQFNGNGASAQGSIWVTNPSPDETWNTAENFSVVDDAPVQLCGDVPTTSTRVLHFTAVIKDVSGYKRPDVSPDPRTTDVTVTEVGDMSVSLTLLRPAKGTYDLNKEVCVTVTANGGGFDVDVTASAPGVPGDVPDTRSGSHDISFEHCVTASGAGQNVTFTATVTDRNHSRGTKDATPVVVQSALDPVGMDVGFGDSSYPGAVPNTDKTTCIIVTASSGSLPATLTISAWYGSETIAQGTSAPITVSGNYTSDPWCVTPPAGTRSVDFTATLEDSDVSHNRTTPKTKTQSVPTPDDPPNLATPTLVAPTAANPAHPHGDINMDKYTCATFQVDVGNLEGTLTITALNQSSTPKSGINTISDTWCVTPSAGTRSVTFTATVEDAVHGRAAKQSNPQPVATPEDPTPLSVDITALTRKGGDGPSTNKEVCATATATAGNASATLVITALSTSSPPKTQEGTFTDSFCVTPTSGGESVEFWATLTDDGYGRSPRSVTDNDSITSPPDPPPPPPPPPPETTEPAPGPSCSFVINEVRSVTVTYTNIPADSRLMFQYNDGDVQCEEAGHYGTCEPFSGSDEITVTDWYSNVDLKAHPPNYWMMKKDESTIIATCTNATPS